MDPFDVRLQDDELLDEVELTANLIVAANQSDAHLSASEIDQVLGLVPAPRTDPDPVSRADARGSGVRLEGS